MSHKNLAAVSDGPPVITKMFQPLGEADLDRDVEFYRAFALDFGREAIATPAHGDESSNPSAR